MVNTFNHLNGGSYHFCVSCQAVYQLAILFNKPEGRTRDVRCELTVYLSLIGETLHSIRYSVLF